MNGKKHALSYHISKVYQLLSNNVDVICGTATVIQIKYKKTIPI